MLEDKLNEIKQDIENYDEINPYVLDIEVIENQSGQIMNLIKDIEDFSYQLKNKYYSFKFTEPIYIQKVIFKTEDDVNLKDLEIVAIDYKNNSSTITFTNKEHKVWLPKKVLNEFKIKAPKRLINKIKLTHIEIVGFKLNDLESIKDKVKELENSKLSLQTLSDDIENKNRELEDKLIEKNELINTKKETIDSLNNDISTLEDEISTLTDSKTSLENDTNQLTVKKESLTTENTNLENNIQQLNETSNQLNLKISNQNDELKKLTEDTNIFATEMKEYIEQGNKDILLYTKLSIIPWVTIALVSLIVFFGASDLTTVFETKENIEISSVFWSRVPFVIIVLSILFVSYEISKIFIKNIIHIHKQKRIFTKIGIIAKDVAEKSIIGLELDEKDKFDLRTKLKMDLLKSHLKNEIGEDYEYKVKTSLLEYLPDFKKKKTEATEDT
ncbi:hypothetical protein FJR48_07475 [Sulfurimonas lithotrophica]|uniref:Uncharacterized protein n=1 Tax=Sulfurimonas lithotrophica TaxID=2590022 RepID=A0A5P8P1H9_9BACT|nr:hypothetical protein [Sulfurimonas lithotrophica]QFR49582.1 hypothetical protein FJR48_07475 [Sulfurimonas lithotrophica]